MNTNIPPTSGTGEFDSVLLDWNVVSEILPDGEAPVVMVAYTLRGDEVALYGLSEVPNPQPVPLCRCEHLSSTQAQYCKRAAQRRTELDHAVTRARIASRPAPEGVRYLRHCSAAWSAEAGGACPRCGALGEEEQFEATVSSSSNLGATLIATSVPVTVAVGDLGLLESEHVRVMDNGAAWVWTAALKLKEITARLRSLGWKVTVAKKKHPAR